MLMKWNDLIPGDIIEYTDDYIEKVCPRLTGLWKTNRVFIIREISSYDKENKILRIRFKSATSKDVFYGTFPMEIETGADFDFKHLYNGPAFKIIKLSED